MRKFSNKKAIALMTSLGVCFVLLALGTVLMINSYAHMNMATKIYYDTEALNIAEAGVNYEIYQMEQIEFEHINDGSRNVAFGKGSFIVSRAANMADPNGRYWKGLNIPRYCIGIESIGTVNAGSRTYKKTVKTVVGVQLVPYTVCSEGTIRMNVGSNEDPGVDPVTTDPADPAKDVLKPFSVLIDAVDGFKGNMHSNYAGTEPAYRCTIYDPCHVSLTVEGGTLSASGKVGHEASEKIDSHGGTAVSGASQKKFIETDYNTLYSKANSQSECIELGDKVPWPFKFKGKLVNDDGELKAKVSGLGEIPLKYDFGLFEVDFTPDGMKWDSGTETLIIKEGKNFKYDGDLKLVDVNIKVEGNKGSGLFVDGNITGENIEIKADAFTLASKDKTITLTDARLNIKAPPSANGVALYTKNLNITTDANKAPEGGHKFKGVVYANGGNIDVTNKYNGADPNSSKFELEGLIINPDDNPDDSFVPCLKVKNMGDPNFSMGLKYNPFVASSLVDYRGELNLQPLYWQID
ncbi:MAG: hypothetical protein ABRQ38_17460 [Candidatus Eremiobacterota bacterium]